MLDEHELTTEWVLKVLDQDRLLSGRRVLGRAVELRNPYVDALCYLQLRALRTLRTDDSLDEEQIVRQRRLLLLTVLGCRRRPAEHRLMFSDLDRPPLDARFLRGRLVRPGSLWTQIDVLAETPSTNAVVAAAARRSGRGVGGGRGVAVIRSWAAGADVDHSGALCPADVGPAAPDGCRGCPLAVAGPAGPAGRRCRRTPCGGDPGAGEVAERRTGRGPQAGGIRSNGWTARPRSWASA